MCVRSLALVCNLYHVPLLSRLSKVGHATQFVRIQPTIGKIPCASPSFWYLMITWIFLLEMFWAILESKLNCKGCITLLGIQRVNCVKRMRKSVPLRAFRLGALQFFYEQNNCRWGFEGHLTPTHFFHFKVQLVTSILTRFY